jgi:hypothetical protein
MMSKTTGAKAATRTENRRPRLDHGPRPRPPTPGGALRGPLRQAGTAGGRRRARPPRGGGDHGPGRLRARGLERGRRGGTRPGRFHRPAPRTEAAFETLASLARDGKTDGAGAPQEPVDAGPRPARVRGGDLLRQPAALRPEDRLRGAGRGRAVARVPGRIPLPVSQAERTLPDRDVTRRSTGRSGVLGTFGGSHARNKRNARKERSTRNGSKV